MAPKLEEWEIKKYWEIFSGLKPINNKLSGDQVSPVLRNSKLSDVNLEKIWGLADIDQDGSLDFEEFCICMRLIFDLVNGTVSSLPLQLPDWLVPSSKSHLVQANQAVSNPNQRYSDSEDEDGYEGDAQFDWYISPVDKATYEQIYTSATDRFGRITYNSLNGLYNTLNSVPETDVRFAWNLVNPRSSETIDKDQTLVFLHMLNQRQNGKRIPRGVPPSLRATFSKEVPEYSLESHQADVHQSKPASKQSFAENYLERLGGGYSKNSKGTDFSSTKDTDWEEVRLKRELADLENKISAAETENERKKNERNSILNGTSTSTKNRTLLIRKELEQLLEYKQKQLINDSESGWDLSSISDDIDTIESQVQILEQYLTQKQDEVQKLKQQIIEAKRT